MQRKKGKMREEKKEEEGSCLDFCPKDCNYDISYWTKVPVPVKNRYWVFRKVVLSLLNHHSHAGGFNFISFHFIFTLAN